MITWILLVLGVTSVYSDTGYFWHVSDFHYDFTYTTTRISCTKNSGNPVKFGNYWCDSPWELIKSSVNAMAQIRSDVDFVLWTGDTILHVKDELHNYEVNSAMFENVTTLLKAKLPNTPVYATFGNHDYFPHNQFPAGNTELYNDTWIRWKDWVGNEPQGDNFRKGGYYTVKTPHGLRIIALNTNLYYTKNKATLNYDDPGDQLKWLDDTLKAARANNENVLITAHIMPGVHTYTKDKALWMYPNYNRRLVDILQTYSDIIVCMHFGHDHADGFKVLSDKQGTQRTTMLTTPSVTPWRFVNSDNTDPAHLPGIKLVSYDRTTGKHLDYELYYLDIERANRVGVDTWELEYRASTAYGLTDLTGQSFSILADKMGEENNHLFQKFWLYHTVSPPESLRESCDRQCQIAVVCGFKNLHMDDYASCKEELTSGTSSPVAGGFAMLLSIVVCLFW